MPLVEQWLTRISWILPAILGVIALLQIIYLLWLQTRSSPRRTRRQPAAPIMPTQPNITSANMNVPDLIVPETITEAKMIVVSGLPGAGEIDLPGNQFAVGRFYNPQAQVLIALNERSISRRHASFRANPALQEFYLADLSSSYGTSIRKGDHFEMLTPGQEERLYNNDIVQFGMTVTVRFVLPGDTRFAATQV